MAKACQSFCEARQVSRAILVNDSKVDTKFMLIINRLVSINRDVDTSLCQVTNDLQSPPTTVSPLA